MALRLDRDPEAPARDTCSPFGASRVHRVSRVGNALFSTILAAFATSAGCSSGPSPSERREGGGSPDGAANDSLADSRDDKGTGICPLDVGPGTADCVSGVVDLPPVPVLRFQVKPPAGDDDYPYGPGSLPVDGPAPNSTVYLSAAGSADPEGAPVSIFWNVQDPSGAYLTITPEPQALRASFTPTIIGPHTITLEVTEVAGLKQTGQKSVTVNVEPIPCADDGVSAPCSDLLAVAGGTFIAGSAAGVGNANEAPSHATTIAPFSLDAYEVTVGRFRAFLDQYTGTPPADGAGANPLLSGSGWQNDWGSALPVSEDDFKFAIAECGGAWTDDVGPSEARPITCITWYEAFAFCVWENKRLPTEAEWEYAAAGGDQQRTYPWGNDPPSASLAVFGCLFDGDPACSDADLPVAGSLAAGAGRWGQLDLGGSVWEWVLDVYAPYTAAPCDNCANIDALDTTVGGSPRVFRGGGYNFDDPSSLRAASRYGFDGAYPDQTRGFRCASSPPTTGAGQ